MFQLFVRPSSPSAVERRAVKHPQGLATAKYYLDHWHVKATPYQAILVAFPSSFADDLEHPNSNEE